MKKTNICILSCHSGIILCSLSYQSAIVAQANNMDYFNNKSKSNNRHYLIYGGIRYEDCITCKGIRH